MFTFGLFVDKIESFSASVDCLPVGLMNWDRYNSYNRIL